MMRNRIVVISGGSFQGKSLISLAVAARLKFSGVLSTDAIRNVLHCLYPEKDYLGTSTYKLSEENLEMQYKDVSKVLQDVIGIYESRGEHMIIEGMHYSPDFYRWAHQKDFCCICFDNKKTFTERVFLKGITRTKFSSSIPSALSKITSMEDVKRTSYFKYKERMVDIHRKILERSRQENFKIISYQNLEETIGITINHINQFFL